MQLYHNHPTNILVAIHGNFVQRCPNIDYGILRHFCKHNVFRSLYMMTCQHNNSWCIHVISQQ